MQQEFEMSLLGELTFFLGLQVQQTKNGIFLSLTKGLNLPNISPMKLFLIMKKYEGNLDYDPTIWTMIPNVPV